jgi:hypothetical protein
MGFLSQLFSKPPTSASTEEPRLYAGEETLEVVGESFHQDALWKLVGGRTTKLVNCPIRATLVPEPDNPNDRNAVMVQIGGRCVGHLSRGDASAYLPGLQRLLVHGSVGLEGVIVGGGRRADGIGFLGVFLDHNPQHFGIPRTGYHYGRGELRTGFSEAVASDFDDDSYDLSWHAEVSDDHATAVQQLRRMLESERDPIDRHYMLSELTKRLYKSRQTHPAALDDFDIACEEHHGEMVAIRAALYEKFGVVPVIETYRQAVIRCQKAKDWPRMREWAERGITVYGNEAARQSVVEDLHKRLAYALAKIAAAAKPKPRRTRPLSTSSPTDPIIEILFCSQCGRSFERLRTRGRKPSLCPDCRSDALTPSD